MRPSAPGRFSPFANVRFQNTAASNRRVRDRPPRRSRSSRPALHVRLLGNLQGVVDLDAKVPNGPFELGVPEQELDGPQGPGAPVDQGGLGTAHGMGAVSTGQSLIVILAILVVTAHASVRSPRGKAKTAVTALRRHAADYLELGAGADFAMRERVYARMVAAELKVAASDPKFKALIRQTEMLKERLAKVHRQHALHGVTRAHTVR